MENLFQSRPKFLDGDAGHWFKSPAPDTWAQVSFLQKEENEYGGNHHLYIHIYAKGGPAGTNAAMTKAFCAGPFIWTGELPQNRTNWIVGHEKIMTIAKELSKQDTVYCADKIIPQMNAIEKGHWKEVVGICPDFLA